MISPVSDDTCGSIGDTTDSERSSDNLYEPKGERRRLQNRLNQRTRRKKLKLTAARTLVQEPKQNDHGKAPDSAVQSTIQDGPHYDHGTIFRLLETSDVWMKEWHSKHTEQDLKAIRKRPALYSALCALRPFMGLWKSFRKGLLHRIKNLKCDDELIHSLEHIRSIWTTIVGGDLTLMCKIDPETVELMETRAPKISTEDREFIIHNFQTGAIFAGVPDGSTRRRLLRNALSVDGMIPSIKTFHEDTIYMEFSLQAIKILIDSMKSQVRETLRDMWRGSGKIHLVLEYEDGVTKETDVQMNHESLFQTSYLQLWMFAMRNFPKLTYLSSKRNSKNKVAIHGPDPHFLFAFASTAKALGFESSSITGLLSMNPLHAHARGMLTKAKPPSQFEYDFDHHTEAHVDLLRQIKTRKLPPAEDPPPFWTTATSDILVGRRVGRPYDETLKNLAPHLFLHNICQTPRSQKYVTDLYVIRECIHRFFNIPPIPSKLLSPHYWITIKKRATIRNATLKLTECETARRISSLDRERAVTERLLRRMGRKLKKARTRVDTLISSQATRLDLQPLYVSSDSETICADEDILSVPYLVKAEDELRDLSASILTLTSLLN